MEQTRPPTNTLATSGENHANVDRWLRTVRLRTVPLLIDRNPIASSTLVQVGGRNLLLTCDHVWKIASERIAIGQRDQPRKNVLLSDAATDVAIIEVPAAAEFWFTDASGLELRCQFAPIDIDELRHIEVGSRPISGYGYPISHQHKERRTYGFSSYFGNECRPPEGYDIPESRFCVRAEVTRRELSDDLPATPVEQLDLKGMSGGPVYVFTETGKLALCGLQCRQLREKISDESMVIWMTIVRPDILADCIEKAITN